jgi:hypothetical protein
MERASEDTMWILPANWLENPYYVNLVRPKMCEKPPHTMLQVRTIVEHTSMSARKTNLEIEILVIMHQEAGAPHKLP